MQLRTLNSLSLSTLVDQVCSFLNQFKDVPKSTNDYLKANIQKRYGFLDSTDIMKAVTNGVGGEYGEFKSVDPQTIFKWLGRYASEMEKGDNYLEQPLVDADYPYARLALTNEDWRKEANKCFYAYKRGIPVDMFSEGVYQRMMLDGLLPFPSVKGKDDMADYFAKLSKTGKQHVYFFGEASI